ncbi:hypothetical protein AK812_SmicGene31085 [Symbiodinium microadriaticum]|uniref:CCHC-type domain-containing protein n=1 Tax=Symbiodinium microadriaticum TaxID=2951 RepID=A0A1Q9CXM0_SYMMI|nr:hypothetical protein AK812_SmicGene31085 [Symbiodinium microadriaticum]
MASDISGPPPGFETDDVGFHEPPAGLPPPPSFGGGDRAEADSDVKSGKPDDDTSREFFDKSDSGARRHQASEGTRREWQWGERTSLSGEDGKVRDDGRSNWSSTAAASGGSEIWTRRRHEDDPWSSGGDPWQRDYGRHRESGERRHDDAMEPWGSHRWSDGRDDRTMSETTGIAYMTVEDSKVLPGQMVEIVPLGYMIRVTFIVGRIPMGVVQIPGFVQKDQGKGPRPSERLTVPTFTAEDSEDLGNSARSTNFAHMTDHTAETDEEDPFDGEDAVPEDVAEAFMTYQSAKERYRNQQRSRGTTGGGNGGDKAPKGDGHSEDRKPSEHRDADRETKLKAMKARSFCGGCGRKGHWHKDDVCPLNRGGDNAKGEASANVAMTTVLPADVFALKHVPSSLLGVADTACARTVAGTQWLQSYSNLLAEIGTRPVLQKECEAYRFGTGKVHYSSFYVVVTFRLGGYNIQVRTSIITGDIPLLLSKTVLGKLGMIYDVENGKADFRAINLKDYVLTTTTSGHPAIPIVPVSLPADKMSDLQIEDLRLQTAEQYMSVCAVAHQGPQVPKYFGIFYEKKLDPSTRIMLSEDRLQRDVFVAWWEKANFDRDFWVETPNTWVRVHMVPRHQPQVLISALPITGMDSERCQSSSVPVSRMTKSQLLAEAVRVGATVHHSWTVPELRATIRDHVDTFMEKSASQKMKGLSSMKHGELVAKAKEMGVDVPDRVTKGNLLRLVRTAVGTTGDTVMTIGRWKGCLYREIPQSYAQWALEETTRTDNSSPELIMFARWWETQMLAKASKTEIKDDESEFEETAQNFRTSTPSRGSASENQVNIRRTSTPSRGSASENQVNIHRTPTSSRGSWDEVFERAEVALSRRTESVRRCGLWL